jgi:hypothetical protein
MGGVPAPGRARRLRARGAGPARNAVRRVLWSTGRKTLLLWPGTLTSARVSCKLCWRGGAVFLPLHAVFYPKPRGVAHGRPHRPRARVSAARCRPRRTVEIAGRLGGADSLCPEFPASRSNRRSVHRRRLCVCDDCALWITARKTTHLRPRRNQAQHRY